MLRSLTMFPLVLTLTACTTAEPSEWTPILFTDDLSGWTIKFANAPVGENVNDTFQARDGVLVVDFSNWDSFDDRFGHIFTNETYEAYDLRFEYRMRGEQVADAPDWALRNNGVMLHAQAPEDMTFEQGFPRSAELQLLNGGPETERTTGNLCTIGTVVTIDGVVNSEHCISTSLPEIETEDWIAVRAEVRRDGTIRHFVNDVLTLEYSDLVVADEVFAPLQGLEVGTPVRSGRIAFQAESHPTEFRNLEIRLRD